MSRLTVLVIILVTLRIVDVTPAGQEEDFRIRADVELVTADVTVIGSAPPELQAEDFIIYDDKVAQQISYFSRDQLPLAVAILIDSSDSIRPYVPALRIAALSALRRLKTGDQAALFSFSDDWKIISDLTEDRLLIAEKIGAIGIGGGTNIYDAIFYTAQYLKKKAKNRRRAIILISDNLQSPRPILVGPARWTAHECRDRLLETATALFSLRISNYDWESVETIKRLAEESGGEMMEARGSEPFKQAFELILLKLRRQYTIGFNPSNPGKAKSFHRLAVKFTSPDCCRGCQLVTRRGYYAGVSDPPFSAPDIQKQSELSGTEIDELFTRRILEFAGAIDLQLYDTKNMALQDVDPDLHEIPFAVSTQEQKLSNGQMQLKIDLKIDFSGIVFSRAEERRACKVHIAVFYANEKGKMLGSDWKKIDGSLDPNTHDRAVKSGMSYSTAIPLKARRQAVKIVVYDEGSEKIGSRLIRLQNAAFSK